MDLGEILSYKPSTSTKRSRDEDTDEPEEDIPLPKKPQKNGMNNEQERELTDEEKLKLLQNVHDDEDENTEVLDTGAVKRMLLSFEKHVLRNQEMRIKFPDQPDKFMESEIELNDEIQSLHIISTAPEYYPVVVAANVVTTLCSLLSHDNSDIAIAVVDLLQEMTDSVVEEDTATVFIDTLLEEQVIALLVQNMERLDEKTKEDSEGIHNTLSIIENMAEIQHRPVTTKAGEQGLLAWLLKRVRVRHYDENKLYSSEILAILLQDHTPNQTLLGEQEGIDILLQSLAYYKRRDPHSNDEIELMENLFDCLCSALMHPPNRDKFLKGEGLQLMRLMLQSKKMSRRSCLKVLNHAMCGAEGKDNCNKFVEILGLGSLFPAFMKTPKGAKKSLGSDEQEEHICSVIASLFRHVGGVERERLIGKFIERDHEKVDRLMELHFKYTYKVHEVDEAIRREKRLKASVESTEEEIQTYLRRLEVGLFTLQLIDYILMEVWLCEIPSIRGRIATILGQRSDTLEGVVSIMREYVGGLGEAESQERGEKERLQLLLKQFEDSVFSVVQ